MGIMNTAILENEKIHMYPRLKDFFVLKEKGLRKQAFQALSSFLDEATLWNDYQQQDFACWLFSICEEVEEFDDEFVHPLEENLLKPILSKWMVDKATDPRPYRWFGLFMNSDKSSEFLKRAFELGGKDEQQALEGLISIKLDSLWYSFHHISEDLFLGNLEEDAVILEELQHFQNLLADAEFREVVEKEINYYRDLLKEWTLFQNGQHKDFVGWCKERGKRFDFVEAFYY